MSSTPTSPSSPVSPPNTCPTLPGSNQQPPENIFRAVRPYSPRHDGEIALHLGDIITNTKELGNGWTLGQNVSRDILGIFPSHCVQPLSVANAALQGLTHGSSTSVDFNRVLTNRPESNTVNKQEITDSSAGLNPRPTLIQNREQQQVLNEPSVKCQEIKALQSKDHPRSVSYNPQLGTFSSPSKQQQPTQQQGVIPTSPHHNKHYLQVAQQNTDGRITSGLLPAETDKQLTASETNNLPYESLRSRPDPDSSYPRSMSHRDVELDFSKQKESPRLCSFKPPPSGGRVQTYSRENSLSEGSFLDGGGISSHTNEITGAIGDQLALKCGGETDKSDCNNKPEDSNTAKGKSSRRASPKRVRVSQPEFEEATTHENGNNKKSNHTSTGSGGGSAVKRGESHNCVAQQRLAGLISEPIEQGESSGSLGDNHGLDYSASEATLGSVSSVRSDSNRSTPLPSPVKRGRFTPKPQLAVKPNHLFSADNMKEGGDHRTIDHHTPGINPPSPSPKVQSRARVKASPRQSRKAGGVTPYNSTIERMQGSHTPPLQLHNATNTPSVANGVVDLEKQGVRRITDCDTTLHKTPTKALRVSAMPAVVGHSHYADGTSRQHRADSPMYASRDTLASCSSHGGGAPQCNSLLYDMDNYTNETLTHEASSVPATSLDNGHKEYYGDYRSLDGENQEQGHMMDKSVRFRTQNNTTARYKPILKHQRVGDSKAQPPQHTYYPEDRGKDPVIRMIFSVICGLIIGFILFCWMYFCLSYPMIVALSVAIAVAILAILALAMSRLVRCITALTLPSVCTTRGRIGCIILVTGLLIGGPVKNIYHNMHEVSRSMACSAEQAFNQSMLLLEPFDSMMQQLETTVAKLEYAAWEVDRGLKPLDAGLKKVDQNIDKGKLFLTYTSEACTGMIQNAFSQCVEGISAAQRKCLGVITDLGTVYLQAKDLLDKINPVNWAPKQQHLFKRQILLGGTSATPIDTEMTEDDKDICVALDMNQVCESLNHTELLCKPSMWAGDAIQEAINATQKAMFHLRKQLQFNVKSDPFSMARVNASKVVFHIRQAVLNQFESRTLYFEHVISILIKIIPVAVLLLFYVSYLHVKHYMSRDTYDNNYITKTFWGLDQKRAEIAGTHLFPLKQYEKQNLIDTTVSDLSPPEEGLFRIGLCVFFLHLLLSGVCYMFDFILYWILSLIRHHGNPATDVTGQAALENVLEGEGVIVELLDIFLIGFHRGNSYGFHRGLNQCLPYPHTPSLTYLIAIAVIYLLLLLTILFKAYLIRLRNHITGFFYPERRKQRTVHLYNVILNQRGRLPKLLQVRARVNSREKHQQEEISFCHKVALRCAPCRVFLYRSSHCLVCGLVEDHTFRDCETEKCSGVYCAMCYSDLGRVCPLCLQGSEYDEDEGGYEEMEDDLQPYQRSSKIYL